MNGSAVRVGASAWFERLLRTGEPTSSTREEKGVALAERPTLSALQLVASRGSRRTQRIPLLIRTPASR
jgi:hypothetical protein